MSVEAVDGLVLKGTLSYPGNYAGVAFPLVVLAHQYPATRDSYAPLVADLLESGVATLAFDERGHGSSIQGSRGPLLIDTPGGLDAEAFGTAFVSSIAKVGFARIDNDILRVTGWGGAQDFIDPARVALVGSSVGGSGVLLAAQKIPNLPAVATIGAAGASAFGPDTSARIRSIVEQLKLRYSLHHPVKTHSTAVPTCLRGAVT